MRTSFPKLVVMVTLVLLDGSMTTAVSNELSGGSKSLKPPQPRGQYFPPATSQSQTQIDSESLLPPSTGGGTVPPEILDLHYLPSKNCSCPEPKSCPPIYVDRRRENVIQVTGGGGGGNGGGKSMSVELIKEEIRERSAPKIEYEVREIMEMQKIPMPMTANVTLERQVVEEIVIYEEIVIDKVEINYKYVDRTVYVEVEEPEVSYDVTVKPFPVVLDHETITFRHDVFRVNLTEEYMDPKGMPLIVKERMDEIIEEPTETVETITCNTIRYVSVPCYPPGQTVPGVASAVVPA